MRRERLAAIHAFVPIATAHPVARYRKSEFFTLVPVGVKAQLRAVMLVLELRRLLQNVKAFSSHHGRPDFSAQHLLTCFSHASESVVELLRQSCGGIQGQTKAPFLMVGVKAHGSSGSRDSARTMSVLTSHRKECLTEPNTLYDRPDARAANFFSLRDAWCAEFCCSSPINR